MGLRVFLLESLYQRTADFAQQILTMIIEAEKQAEEDIKESASASTRTRTSGFSGPGPDFSEPRPYIPPTEPTEDPVRPFGDILDGPVG